jgi:hypothetical protein
MKAEQHVAPEVVNGAPSASGTSHRGVRCV